MKKKKKKNRLSPAFLKRTATLYTLVKINELDYLFLLRVRKMARKGLAVQDTGREELGEDKFIHQSISKSRPSNGICTGGAKSKRPRAEKGEVRLSSGRKWK